MDGNKLKHKFVKKEKKLETNDWVRSVFDGERVWVRSVSRYAEMHRGGLYPVGTVDGVNVNYEQPPEISPVEEVSTERVVTMNELNTYGDRIEELKGVIKADMVKKLAQQLLENGFVESVEVIEPSNFSTKIKMRIKAKKLIQ
jgi:hypothetical protein